MSDFAGQARLNLCKTILIAVFLFSLFSSAYAESDIKEGYDENTEITIKGTLIEMIHVKRGPVILRIKTSGKSYNVVTAPRWYLSRESITFSPDSVLEITGSKYYGADGNLYIIGRQIKNIETGKQIMLRDSFCKPLWGRHKMHDRRLP
ncbi:MAG: hypothetical protein M1147_02630 [Nitrospirae bacterium]|nr:hypothetical protein [Nitrospirota bacterium]MCL5977010.1 hypothetical protein [Nitrospirota bacterium]